MSVAGGTVRALVTPTPPQRSQSPVQKPRVGIVLIGGASEGGGGTGRRFARLFEFLQQTPKAEQGCEVFLVTPRDFLELMSRSSIEIDESVRVIDFPQSTATPGASPLDRLAVHRDASEHLARLAKQAAFDLVHIPIPHLAYAPYLLRKPDGVHTTFSMTAAIGAFDSLNWKAKLLYRLGFERADAIDTLYSDVPDRFPSFARKIHVSPCSFTDYSRFQPASDKSNTIVFAGRLEPFKNPLLFVDAVALASETLRETGWRCEMYGDGELKGEVETRIAERGVADLVTLDRVPDLSAALSRSRIFASLQQTENYPSQVLLEAMASANAVIATDVGDTRRLVDEEVGRLIPPGDPGALARCLEGVVRDASDIDVLAARARDRILGQHTVARYADYLQAFWLEALGQTQSTPPPSWTKLARMALGGALGFSFH